MSAGVGVGKNVICPTVQSQLPNRNLFPLATDFCPLETEFENPGIISELLKFSTKNLRS